MQMSNVRSRALWLLLLPALLMLAAVGCAARSSAPESDPPPQEQQAAEAPQTQRTEDDNQGPPEESGQTGPETQNTDTPEEDDMRPGSTEEKIRVAILLESPSVASAGYDFAHIAADPAARAYQERLEQEQDELIRRIEEATGETLDVKWRFTLTSNVISADIRPGHMERIRAMEGVADVAPETLNHPTGSAAPTVMG